MHNKIDEDIKSYKEKLKNAASKLRNQTLYDDNIAGIGISDKDIVVYTKTNYNKYIPSVFEGIPVRIVYSGPFQLL